MAAVAAVQVVVVAANRIAAVAVIAAFPTLAYLPLSSYSQGIIEEWVTVECFFSLFQFESVPGHAPNIEAPGSCAAFQPLP